jgi:hypothetical protein
MPKRSWWTVAGVTAAVPAVVAAAVVLSGNAVQDAADGPTARPASSAPRDATLPTTLPTARPTGPPGGVAPRDQEEEPDRPLALTAVVQSYERAAPDKVRLRYTTGVPQCYGSFDRVLVRETAERVLVTVLLTPPPTTNAGVACPEIALVEQTSVSLQRALGDRLLVDGATGERVPRVTGGPAGR